MEYWKGAGTDQIMPADYVALANADRIEPQKLAGMLVVELRHHGHFNNVLTHIFAADWREAEAALARLLDLNSESDLSNREADLVSLLCGERGVTGKLMRPWMAAQLRRFVPNESADRLERTWFAWHNLRMILPVRFRKSAMRAIRDA
ncbi:hypothetical protein [Devosia submarina]|uniref:hypothetical protein n=1 Tax=Devosia submarina TaxID=1173082 RepID=UPI000D3B76CF|nr:hypothetical protein [Devosia submarina]